ncbi:MAG: heme-binding domain-containing protein [Flavobacteriales bacterium]|nr:heme-binding domain-containing protein [Flavobacteriales bacterium]NQX96843.1 heme-binding domain-containing protein [Flavobacteriales bacterium]
MKKKILYGLLIIFVIIQFFRINKTNPPVNSADDFIKMTNPPQEISVMLKTSCYDCHSNESTYPWYSNIAPVSWWLKHHIDEAREELNFSKWSTYNLKRQDHKLEEMLEEVEKGEMPLKPYPLTHPEAQLTPKQKKELKLWFKKVRADINKPQEKEELQLNNGEKWITNTETNVGIKNFIAIINNQNLDFSNKGENLNTEMKRIFAECTMQGEAHNQLHLYLLPMVKMFRELKESETYSGAILKQTEIKQHLASYETYFK